MRHFKQENRKPSQRQNYTVTDIQDSSQEEEKEAPALQFSNVESHRSKVLLLTGVAKVRNERTGNLQEVEVLLDTGTDKSFINKQLADELELSVMKTIGLSVYTFGSMAPKHKKFDVFSLTLCDAKGDTHDLLCQTDVITEKAKRVWLAMEGLEYLERQNIVLSNGHRSVNPQTLLGCDQLWPILASE